MTFPYSYDDSSAEDRAAVFRELRHRVCTGDRQDFDRSVLMRVESLAPLSATIARLSPGRAHGISPWKLTQVLREKRGLSPAELRALTPWLRLGLESMNANKLGRLKCWAEAELGNPIIIDEHARAVLAEVCKRASVICLPGAEGFYW